MIRPAQTEHFATVARLHAEAIPQGFLSSLGGPFLTELYRSLASEAGTFVLVAIDADGECRGFVAGTVDTKGLFARVLRRHGYRFLRVAGRHLVSPMRLKSAVETVLYGLLGERAPRDLSVRAELLALAVDGPSRGAGTGKALVSALEASLGQLGVAHYKVATVAEDAGSNAFYHACGFARSRSFQHHDVLMNEYIKAVGSSDLAGSSPGRCPL